MSFQTDDVPAPEEDNSKDTGPRPSWVSDERPLNLRVHGLNEVIKRLRQMGDYGTSTSPAGYFSHSIENVTRSMSDRASFNGARVFGSTHFGKTHVYYVDRQGDVYFLRESALNESAVNLATTLRFQIR